MDDEYQIEYLNNLYTYRDSVLQMVEEGSYQYVIAYTPELLQQGRGEEAIEMLEAYHQKLSSGYARLCGSNFYSCLYLSEYRTSRKAKRVLDKECNC